MSWPVLERCDYDDGFANEAGDQGSGLAVDLARDVGAPRRAVLAGGADPPTRPDAYGDEAADERGAPLRGPRRSAAAMAFVVAGQVDRRAPGEEEAVAAPSTRSSSRRRAEPGKSPLPAPPGPVRSPRVPALRAVRGRGRLQAHRRVGALRTARRQRRDPALEGPRALLLRDLVLTRDDHTDS